MPQPPKPQPTLPNPGRYEHRPSIRWFRRMKAKAWAEGYTSGHSNAMRRMSDEPNAPTTPNPYE